jgi:hypothetical protein
MDERLKRFVRTKMRQAGRRFEETKQAYREGRRAASQYDLPTDAEGRARIVCRRYAEQRAVRVNADGEPDCYDGDHPDCRGCAEDVREGYVETW